MRPALLHSITGLAGLVGVSSVLAGALAGTFIGALVGCHDAPTVAATPAVVAPIAAVAAGGEPAAAPAVAPSPGLGGVRYVVIVSEDGFRPDTIDPVRTPNHVALMKAGTTARLARTVHESDTLPSHASMLSGFDPREHGLDWNSFKPDRGFIHVPTVFSIAREHGMSTAMFIGKPKLRHIAIPGSVNHLERPGYFCSTVVKRAAAYFASDKPRLMFVHFSDPDDYGHLDGWMSPAYIQGIANSDKCLGTLLAAIDKSGVAAQTLLIVTADHGGHSKVHSGSAQEVDREIPWIARGPGVRPGTVIERPMITTDTAATVLSVLKLPSPKGIVGSNRLN